MANVTQNPASPIVLDTATRHLVNGLFAQAAQYQLMLQAIQSHLEVVLTKATGVDFQAGDWDLDAQRGILTRAE